MLKEILSIVATGLKFFSPEEAEKRRLKEVSKLKLELKDVNFALSKFKIFKKDVDSTKYYNVWRKRNRLQQRIKDLAG